MVMRSPLMNTKRLFLRLFDCSPDVAHRTLPGSYPRLLSMRSRLCRGVGRIPGSASERPAHLPRLQAGDVLVQPPARALAMLGRPVRLAGPVNAIGMIGLCMTRQDPAIPAPALYANVEPATTGRCFDRTDRGRDDHIPLEPTLDPDMGCF